MPRRAHRHPLSTVGVPDRSRPTNMHTRDARRSRDASQIFALSMTLPLRRLQPTSHSALLNLVGSSTPNSNNSGWEQRGLAKRIVHQRHDANQPVPVPSPCTCPRLEGHLTGRLKQAPRDSNHVSENLSAQPSTDAQYNHPMPHNHLRTVLRRRWGVASPSTSPPGRPAAKCSYLQGGRTAPSVLRPSTSRTDRPPKRPSTLAMPAPLAKHQGGRDAKESIERETTF